MTWHVQYRKDATDHIEGHPSPERAIEFACRLSMLYQRRKSYVIEKWCGVPQVNAGPLQYVRTVEIRL
jgi:hypothetical protein